MTAEERDRIQAEEQKMRKKLEAEIAERFEIQSLSSITNLQNGTFLDD